MVSGPFNIIMQTLLGIIALPWKPDSKQSFLNSIAFQQVWHQGNNYTLRLGTNIITYPCPKSSACSANPFRWKVSLEPYNTNAHFITRTMQAVGILNKFVRCKLRESGLQLVKTAFLLCFYMSVFNWFGSKMCRACVDFNSAMYGPTPNYLVLCWA